MDQQTLDPEQNTEQGIEKNTEGSVKQSIGQGLNALIPPRYQASKQREIDQQQSPDISSLERQISNKINDVAKGFSVELAKGKEYTEPPKENIIPVSSLKKEEKIFYIETEKIKPNPLQPRKNFSPESLQELAQSIREYGILEPLIVSRQEKETERGTEVEYILIAGERRWRAAKLLHLPTVPAIIKKPLAETKRLEMALIENIQREDLNPLARASAFRRLIEEFGLTQQELAMRLGKSREVIANSLRLLQLPFEAQKLLEEGKINEGHARAILLFSNPEKRRVFLKEILAKNLSGREAWELAQSYLRKGAEKRVRSRQKTSLDPQDLELKEKIENVLQVPVLIKRKGQKGVIELKFFSETDFQKIIQKLTQE